MLLALGLNIVVVGGSSTSATWRSSIGAYAYALLSSDQYDIHLPTIGHPARGHRRGHRRLARRSAVTTPDRRLPRDRDAFFFQVFLTATNNGDDVFGESITNGPNGILNVDEFSIFGWDFRAGRRRAFNVAYLYVALVFFVAVYVALHLLNDSRTGRAWRSPEDLLSRADGDAGPPAQADGVRRSARRSPP